MLASDTMTGLSRASDHTPHAVLLGAKAEVYLHDSAHLWTVSEIIRSLPCSNFSPYFKVISYTTSDGLYVQNSSQLRAVWTKPFTHTVDL